MAIPNVRMVIAVIRIAVKYPSRFDRDNSEFRELNGFIRLFFRILIE
jgi:hypothetical protein